MDTDLLQGSTRKLATVRRLDLLPANSNNTADTAHHQDLPRVNLEDHLMELHRVSLAVLLPVLLEASTAHLPQVITDNISRLLNRVLVHQPTRVLDMCPAKCQTWIWALKPTDYEKP